MKIKKLSNNLFFILLWILINITIFISFSARVSYINSIDIWETSLSHEVITSFFSFKNLGNLIYSFSGMVAFSFACISMGKTSIKTLKLNFDAAEVSFLAHSANIATFFIVGNSIYSSVFLILAGLYKITPAIVLLGIFIGIFLGMPEAKGIFGKLSFIEKESNSKWKRIEWLSIFVIGITVLSTAARISYDSSAIYFSNAKITAYAEHLKFFSNDTFVASSFQNSIQFAMLIQVFGDQSARMISWMCGMIIVIFCLSLGEIVGLSRSARTIAVTLLITSTAFIDLLGDGKVDLISTAVAIATVYWMVATFKQKKQNNIFLIFIGTLAGFSIIGRPFNAFLLGLFIILFYLTNQIISKVYIIQKFKNFIALILQIGIGIGITSIFHLFVNWMIYKDALAFLQSISNINSASGPWDSDPKIILVLRLLYPLTVTFRNTPQSLGTISPLVIIFLPTIFIKKIRNNIKPSLELKLISSIAAITIILWIFLFFTVVEIRYVLFLWIIIFLFIAKLIETYIHIAGYFLQNFSVGLIGFLLMFISIRTSLISLSTFSPIDKIGTPQCSNFILCDFFSEINQIASDGERVLTLAAFRYYLREDLFACSTSNNEYSVLKDLSYKSIDLFWEEVYRQGYSYVIYENDYTTRHLQFKIIPDPSNVPEWVKLERIDKYDTDFVGAYKIIYKKPPVERINVCTINDQGIWSVVIK